MCLGRSRHHVLDIRNALVSTNPRPAATTPAATSDGARAQDRPSHNLPGFPAYYGGPTGYPDHTKSLITVK
ncbi:hypothetical protein GCM10009678_78650 [Actinomadura kijaniata]